MTQLRFLKGMQIYFPGGVTWSRKPLHLRRGPAWMNNPAALSVPQLRACLALARAAHDRAYGRKGKRYYKGMMMPAPAVIVAETVPKGVGVHGGKSPDARRRERHRAAAASIAALEALLAAKGAAPTAPAPA